MGQHGDKLLPGRDEFEIPTQPVQDTCMLLASLPLYVEADKPQEKRPALEANLRGTLITWYIYRMSYSVALCFVKLSILFFYRAIASHKTFRRFVHATIWFVILFTIAVTFAAAFQCENPANSISTAGYLAQFDRDPKTKRPQVKCFDPAKLWVFTAAINLFTDVLIMLLPIPTLLGLRVAMSKRLALVGIFSVGIMGIVASCVRMWVMALWAESPQNAAQFGADLLLWGQVETNAGILSASVPFLRLFFSRAPRQEREKEPSEKNGQCAKRRVISPPKAVQDEEKGMDNKPMEIESVAFFGEGRRDVAGRGSFDDENGRGGPDGYMWKPFITVPASLSSRGSGMITMEPVQPHATV
jgi:hypothetical protein